MNKIVFLDIDGPVIPFSSLLIDPYASVNRVILSPIPVAMLNSLCQRSSAKIVFNTTHNISLDNIPDIDEVLISTGLRPEYLHEDMKTKYPQIPRDVAIREWLQRHSDVEDWIAFDDARFTADDNLIWVDPDAGLHLGHLNQALDRWNCTQFLVL